MSLGDFHLLSSKKSYFFPGEPECWYEAYDDITPKLIPCGETQRPAVCADEGWTRSSPELWVCRNSHGRHQGGPGRTRAKLDGEGGRQLLWEQGGVCWTLPRNHHQISPSHPCALFPPASTPLPWDTCELLHFAQKAPIYLGEDTRAGTPVVS